MSQFADSLLNSVKLNLREAGNDFDSEIKEHIDACATDLKDAGILSFYFTGTGEIDPQIKQAVKWYCRSVYGLYNADMEKYDRAYRSLKATIATQSKYTKSDYNEEESLDLKAIQEQLKKHTEDISELKEIVKPISSEEIETLFEEDSSL